MGALNLAITGAAGYIGQHTVAKARAEGHRVTALVRDASTVPAEWAGDPGITVVAGDLAVPDHAIRRAVAEADVLLHIAAAMSRRDEDHARDTLTATQELLHLVPERGKVVLLGSIAVYDVADLENCDLVSEKTPLITSESEVDAYARAKREQEKIALGAAAKRDFKLTILRAGVVFGPGRLWNAHLGPTLGPFLLRLEAGGQIPLCHISTCAAALVAAAVQPATAPINVLDEDLPDRIRYLQCLKNRPRLTLPLHWRLMQIPARGLAAIGLENRMPGVLRAGVLRARFLPLEYDNSRMRHVLGLRQEHGFEALMHEAQA